MQTMNGMPEQGTPDHNGGGALNEGSPHFTTTHWSVVLDAQGPSSPRASAALEVLCRAYWYPLYAYARRQGADPPTAEDQTQAFFERLLEKNYLAQVRRERGRFRSFLLKAFDHFLCEEWKRNQAKKRGGGRVFVPIDIVSGEEWYRHEPLELRDPAKLFDRRWALTVLHEAKARLKAQLSQKHTLAECELLETLEEGGQDAPSYAQAGEKLGLAEGNVRKLVFRMRERHKSLIREVVEETVGSPMEVDEELRFLLRVVSEKE
jgi:RNA polymerase sigma-70 factor (ECF subfamily)